MIKQFLIIYLLLFNTLIYAQVNPGATCAQAGCSTSGTYTSLTGTPSIGGYSCLGSTPNANWLAIGISTTGSIHLTLTQVNTNGFPSDIDFALFGPFTSVTNGCPLLSNLNAVDCSFSGSNVELVDIANAVAGQVYILLTTNFSGASGTITLAQNPNLQSTGSINCNINFTATVAKTGAACFFSNGTATVTPSGGYPPYTYLWNTPGNPTTPSVSNLAAGTYSVTVNSSPSPITNQNFNPVTISVTIPTITATYSSTSTPAYCSTANNGTASASFNMQNGNTGITATYVWNDPLGQTTSTATGLFPGTYICSITLSNGCTGTTSVTVGTQPAMQITQSSNNSVSCFGGTNGSVSVAVTNGNAPYSYLWSNSATTNSLSNVAAGTYTVQVTDVNSCVQNGSFTILQPSILNGNFSAISNFNGTNISCFNGNNGSATITGTGGVGPYSYLWNNGSTLSNPTNLIAGNNTVTISDANQCVVTDTIILIQPTEIQLSESHQNISCFGGSNGTINLAVTGGTAPYTFSWSNNTNSQNLSNLSIGTYTVVVTDTNGCSKSLSVTLTQPTTPLSSSDTHVDILCKSFSTGMIDLTVNGGTTPYNYLWSNGQTTQDIDSLLSGTYSVSITDANSCLYYDTIQLTEPSNALSYTSIVTSINCFGDATGAINITSFGGTAPYTYVWTNAATTEDIDTILTGNYQLTITDAHLCVLTTDTINIPQPLAPIALTAVIDAVKCHNGSDGAINLSVTGGTAPYTYSWSNGQIAQDIDSLILGNYEVIVLDSKGCSDSSNYQVTQPVMPLTLGITHTDALCVGGTQGTIDLTVTGGTFPYNYLWNNFKTTPDLDSLNQGFYYVLVTDANGCNDTISATVLDPNNSMILSIIKNDVQCFAGSDGTINLSVQFGTPGFSYNWNTGASSQDLNNLPFGTYAVDVTDTNSCGAFISVVINQPATPVSGTISSIDVLCKNFATGAIDVTNGGGIAPYTYLWSNNQQSQDLQNLTAGIYTVTIKDSHNCILVLSDTIFEPATEVSANESHINVKCFSNNTGSINITPTGGVGNYSFQWLSGETTEDIDSLIAGNYFVTIKDGNNCTFPVTVVITQPIAALSLATTITNVSCFNGSNGLINLTPSGGTMPYSYFWSDSTTNQDLINYPFGTYSVIVTDTNNCSDSIVGTITQPTLLVISGSTTPVICHGDATGTATVVANGGTPGYYYLWSNGDQNAMNDSIITGNYSVLVTDNLGCKDSLTVFVNEPTLLTSSTTHIDNPCFGDAVGSVSVVPSGGIAPYTYSWSNFATSATISNLLAGVYTVIVTDSNNCIVNDTSEVLQPLAPLNINFVTSNVLCFNGTTGAIDATTSGGTTPYVFSWNTTATLEDLSNLPIGIYTLTVTDDHNCVSSKTETITEPALLDTSNVILDNISCNGFSDGSINLTTVGGVTPYSFDWSNASTNEDLTNVPIGTYTLTITDAHLCVSQFTYTLNQPLPLISTYTTIEPLCYAYSDGSITLNTTGGTTPYSYSWTNGSTSVVNSGIVTGNYTATITDAQNCVFVLPCFIDQPDQIQVSFNVSDTVGCDPTMIEFTNTSDEQFISTWEFGDGNSATGNNNITNTYTSPGCFDVSLTVESPIGCTNFVTYPSIICINPTPTAGISANPTTLDTSNPETEILNTTTGAVSYEWDMGDNGLYNFFQPGMYTYPMYTLNEFIITLTATSDKGCLDTAQYKIYFDNSLIFYVPNTFTPDGNEYNNVFKPILTSIVDSYLLQIYNRWGELIFESNDKEVGWDGSYNGSIVQNGAYNWVIKIKTDGTQTHTKRGNVLLLR
jgi:gliding motility-associated-like protein